MEGTEDEFLLLVSYSINGSENNEEIKMPLFGD